MSSKWIKRGLCVLLMAAVALPALALDRVFPLTAKRAKMTPGIFPVIALNGTLHQLSAGARIYNRNNTIDMLGSIAGKDIIVNYTEDGMGYVDRVWILTRVEAEQELPTMDADAAAAAQAAQAAAAAAAAQAAAAQAAAQAAAAAAAAQAAAAAAIH